MTLNEPINIDLLSFVKTGKFDYVKPGQTKEWLINNFPDPDDNQDSNAAPTWFYGNIEFHFDKDGILFLIFSDHLDTLNGGQSLRLNKWIFDTPKELTIGNVVQHLIKERIGFKLEYGRYSNDYTSASIEIIASGVKLSFALPERDDEDYEQYIERCKNSDSNLFRLCSFSLMRK